MSKFKIGDRVVISRSSRYYGDSDSSNPPDSVIGTIDRLNSICSISVQWDNHCHNSYSETDLVLASSILKSSFPSVRDSVRIAKHSRYYSPDNPSNPMDTDGIVTSISASSGPYSIHVTWANGRNNVYEAKDLVLSSISLSTVADLSGNTYKKGDRVKIIANSNSNNYKLGDICELYEEKAAISAWRCKVISTGRVGNWVKISDMCSTTESVQMSPSFKVGDIVKVIGISGGSNYSIGAICTINKQNSNRITWELKDVLTGRIGNWIKEYDIVHYDGPISVSSPSPKYKVGDTVKIIANTNSSNNKVGDVGVINKTSISSYDSGTTIYEVFVPRGRTIDVWTKEYDMELFTGSTLAPPISIFNIGDIVEIINNRNYSSNKVGDIGKIIAKGYLDTDSTYAWTVQVPGGPTSSIDTKEIDMIHTSKPLKTISTTTDARPWRVKTRDEMIDEGIMSSDQEYPSDWSYMMVKYFGTPVPDKYWATIAEKSNPRAAIDAMDHWAFEKRQLTQAPLPPTKTLSDFEESDISVALDYLDTVSFTDSSNPCKEIVEDKSYWDTTPKKKELKVLTIPHKKRPIF